MRTCVNGIVRFSKKGDFNNSFHLSRKGMLPPRFAKIVRDWSAHIQGRTSALATLSKPQPTRNPATSSILTRLMLGTSSDTLATSISTDSTVFSKA